MALILLVLALLLAGCADQYNVIVPFGTNAALDPQAYR